MTGELILVTKTQRLDEELEEDGWSRVTQNNSVRRRHDWLMAFVADSGWLKGEGVFTDLHDFWSLFESSLKIMDTATELITS